MKQILTSLLCLFAACNVNAATDSTETADTSSSIKRMIGVHAYLEGQFGISAGIAGDVIGFRVGGRTGEIADYLYIEPMIFIHQSLEKHISISGILGTGSTNRLYFNRPPPTEKIYGVFLNVRLYVLELHFGKYLFPQTGWYDSHIQVGAAFSFVF